MKTGDSIHNLGGGMVVETINSVMLEISPVSIQTEWGKTEEFDVFLHRVPPIMEGTHWEGKGTVPFKWIGFLTAEEVGQISGGN